MDKKIRVLFWICTAAVIVSTAWSLIRSLRPSRGKPYERVSVEEACDYMSFETTYCILDVRDEEEYEKAHVDGAKSLPVREIVARVQDVIPDRSMMIYVYGADSDESCSAAQKLSDIGYTSVTETGSYADWASYKKETEP